MVLFTELLGDSLGNFVNVLILLHAIAFLFWMIQTFREATRGKKTQKFH